MKVNFSNKTTKVEIQSITVGSTFLCKRTDTKEEGLYMRIDINSGAISLRNPYQKRNIVAVNLSTGQLRQFYPTDLIEPNNAEVICK